LYERGKRDEHENVESLQKKIFHLLQAFSLAMSLLLFLP